MNPLNFAAPSPSADPARLQVVIRHGEVIDGTGSPRRRADVGIIGDRIVALGDLAAVEADTTLDATDKLVAPGFIDVHTHDDRALLSTPAMTPKLSQGVTTVITGNCGISLAPLSLNNRRPPPPLDLLGDQQWYRFPDFRDYVQALEQAPAAVNAALLVGHSTLRVNCLDRVDRAATTAEIAVMGSLLQAALDAGAIGFSTGLFYPTNRPAPAAEVTALATIAAAAGGIYTTHMRDEADQVEDSLAETFATAAAAGVSVVISHHKCAGPRNWGRSIATLQLIDQARQHQPVGLDVYPYAASSTVLMPELINGPIRVLITWSEAAPEMAGQDLQTIAATWNCSLEAAIERLQPAGAVYFQMDEADVQRILAYPHSMIGSDGLPHDRFPHPRLWGAFPRVLGHYSRELGLFSLEEAVRRMTGLSADQFRLVDRGVLRVGAFADVVVFDGETISDRSTFDQPTRPASGIDWVLVNGTIAWGPQGATGSRSGRVLRRSPPDRTLP